MVGNLEFWDERWLGKRWVKSFVMTFDEVQAIMPFEVDLHTQSIYYASSVDWCKSTRYVKGMWTIHRNPAKDDFLASICFENLSDALLYKLTWGGKSNIPYDPR